MPLELIVAGAIAGALTLYALSGGADFGGGVWDLLARGPRARAQRRLVAAALAPIWEANHVWLIVVIVLLFTAFPSAFAAAATALHIPLTLMLIGIVLRGSAFVFRSFSAADDPAHHRWSLVFAISSVVTPIMLGACVGAAVSGSIRVKDSVVSGGYLRPWLAPFPLALGLFLLALFAFLAAVYLIHETEDPGLREDFRRRALLAGAATGLLAWLCFLLSREGAPVLHAGLSSRWWSWPFHAAVGLTAGGALAALALRRYSAARALAVAQTTLVVWGWALSQYPFALIPDLPLSAAAAPPSVLRPLVALLALGGALVLPAFLLLYRLFKTRRPALGRPETDDEGPLKS